MRNLTPTNRLLLILTLSAVALIMGTASVFAADVNLMWDPSTSSSLSGYKLYYGTASRSYGTVKPVGNVTSNTVTGLNVGTYYFSATSVDSVGNESGFSNEVSQAVSAPCTYSLSLPGQSFGSGAGTGSVGVNAGSGCNWTAVSNAAWIGISAGASGSGPGTVSYTVQANTLTSSRTGTLTIAGVTFTITQTAAAPACSFTLSPASASFGSGATSGTVSVTAPSGCNWIASSNATWITISSGSSGTGNGTVSYSVLSNSGTTSRTGTMTIAGITFTVTQTGTSALPGNVSLAWDPNAAPNLTGYKIYYGTASRSYGTVKPVGNVTTDTVSGLNVGTYYFSATAVDSVGNESGFSNEVAQTVSSVPTCTYSVSPASASFSESATSGTVSVTVGSGCTWSASSNATWLGIVSGASGTGNGTVSYSVLSNAGTTSRTGTMTIAGQSFTVTQTGNGCTFSIAPGSQSFGSSASSGSVSITGPGTCPWSASGNTSWIHWTSPSSGSGSATLLYSVDRNPKNKGRTDIMLIAGQTFTVTQAARGVVFFSQVANGAEWVSSFVITNPSSTETAAGTITMQDDKGEPLLASVNNQSPDSRIAFTIAPLGSATYTTDGAGSLATGSAKVDSDVAVSGVVKYSHPSLGMAGVSDASPLHTLMTAVVRDKEKELNTGLALANTLSRQVELNLSLRGLDGQEVAGGSAVQTLPAGGHVARFIDQLFPNADTGNFKGTLFVSADGSEESVIATVIQIGSRAGEFTTMPIVAVNPQPMTRELYFAQFATGADWTTSLFLTNPTGSASAGVLTFYDDEGNPLSMSVNGQSSARVSSNLQARGGAFIPTDGDGALVSGSARVTSDNGIGGVLRFASPALGMAGVGASDAVDGFIAPVSRNGEGNFSTGVAVASIGSPVSLRMTLRNEKGEAVAGGQVTLVLRANGHMARFVEQLFPEADTKDFHGTITVSAEGGKIAGTAIQIGARAGQFTTLPVTELR